MTKARFLPLIWVGLSLVLFGVMIVGHERHLATGQTMYVKLAPADPRSMIQGDYMALNYELYLTDDLQNSDVPDKLHITTTVALDDQRRVTKTDILAQMDGEKLMINNPNRSSWGLYPASKSFMFAEGLADCYEQASYAHLIVDDKGKPMLKELVNDNLKSLLCEQKARLD